MEKGAGMGGVEVAGMAEEDQQRMMTMIDSQEARESLRMYNALVERCFGHCVDSFRRKTLEKQEETCVKKCAEKFLKLSMRVSMRFRELNYDQVTPD